MFSFFSFFFFFLTFVSVLQISLRCVFVLLQFPRRQFLARKIILNVFDFIQAVGSYLFHHKSPILLRRSCPSILFCIVGHYAFLYCAVFTGQNFIVDPLTTLMLLQTPNDPEVARNIARVLAAAKKASVAIDENYEKGKKHNNGFPYKVACKAEQEAEAIKFKYTGRLKGMRKKGCSQLWKKWARM